MKKTALLALSLLATSAFAADYVSISGSSRQSAVLNDTVLNNLAATYGNKATQNLASNTGSVGISGRSEQTVTTGGGSVLSNQSIGANTVATQNLSTNMGSVSVSGTSVQFTSLRSAGLVNVAGGAGALAVQNVATNNSCSGCN